MTEKIRESADKQMNEMKNRARELAEQELDAASRQLRIANQKMKEDLQFHAKTTSELQNDNEKLSQKVERLLRQIEIFKSNETQTAKQTVSLKQQIQVLTSKNTRLQV